MHQHQTKLISICHKNKSGEKERMSMPTTTVFDKGTIPVRVRRVKPDLMKVTESLNKEVMVVAPMQAGKYPVIVFLHGFELAFHYYEQLLQHVASHGFIAVAPQVRCCTSAPFLAFLPDQNYSNNCIPGHACI
jgi:chlorophyllase